MRKTSIVAGCVLSMGVEAADFTLTWGKYLGAVGHNIVAFCGVNDATPSQVASVPAVATTATVALPAAMGDLVQCYLRARRLSDMAYSAPSIAVAVTALPETETETTADQAPVAKAGGPYNSTLGSTIPFNGGASTDPEQQPLTYDWNFGDGSAHGTGVAPRHVYNSAGIYTVTLVVNDGGTSSAPASATATVINATTSVNLLVNNGFETGSTYPWAGNGGRTNATADRHSGTWAHRVWGGATQWSSIQQGVAVVAGTSYDFSGWMRVAGKTTTASNSGRYYTFQIGWYNASGKQIGSSTPFGTTFRNIPYTRFNRRAVAPAGAVTARLRFLAAQASGIGYIDDLSIAAVP
jgi:PKD repeat protein